MHPAADASTPLPPFSMAFPEPGPQPRIDWHEPAAAIAALVCALEARRGARGQHQQPSAPATATIGRQAIGVCRARAGGTMSSYPAGTITRCDDELWVQTGRGHLAIDRIVVNGEERDAARHFVAAGFTPGDAFDTSFHGTSPSRPTSPKGWSRAA